MYSIIALLLNALVAFCLAADQCIPSTVKEYSSCACKLNSTNKYINLSPLQNASVVPRFTTNTSNIKQEENWYFSYNPCKPFDMFVQVTNHSCKDVAVGRWTSLTSSPTRQSVCQDLGDQNNVVFDTTPFNLTQYGFDWSNVTLKFTPAKGRYNEAVIHLVCNRNMTEQDSAFHYLYEDSKSVHLDYVFALESRCSCPGLCGEPPSGSNPKPSKSDDNKWLIIGLSIGAAVLLLLIIIAIIISKNARRGYTGV